MSDRRARPRDRDRSGDGGTGRRPDRADPDDGSLGPGWNLADPWSPLTVCARCAGLGWRGTVARPGR
jgi:hypothetical protein